MPAARYWAVIPAAGVVRRMVASLPKQFLQLGKQTVLEHSLDALWRALHLEATVLVSEGHPVLASIQANHADRNLLRAPGGSERCHSVLNGLSALSDQAEPGDWVLVHDAARPCVRQQDLRKLVDSLKQHRYGGLLGSPARDTMKRAEDGAVRETVDRNGLWHAFTPQMFRFGLLHDALQQALEDGYEVTDESSAVEHAGYRPLMVEGHLDNIKITRPEDLPLAEFFLSQQGRL